MRFSKFVIFSFIFAISFSSYSQDIELFQQFNGRYDYTAIGNTLNNSENGNFSPCDILTTSSADLSLATNQNIVAAYLYWAGSGPGDFDIEFNGIPIIPDRTFSNVYNNKVYFSAFTDITLIIQNLGNTTYTVSEFDLTEIIAPYCSNLSGSNFGGWAITVIYEDPNLPLNQLNIYDGLQRVPDNITITLDNLNVLDNEDAKIGFIAWEGDAGLAVNEQLTINGNIIGNPPLNPTNNAFNGTNSFTGATDLYNMDIDVYDIQNNISIGDNSAIIELTSGQDLVFINNIITVLNSQLPDATIMLNDYTINCGDQNINIEYTVFNTNSTDPLPANTQIAFYADNELVGQSVTLNDIQINDFEIGTISLLIPESVGDSFVLSLVVDDNGTGIGAITEINETNNSFEIQLDLLVIPPIEFLPEVQSCNEAFSSAVFNLVDIFNEHNITVSNNISFYANLSDLELNTNEINVPENYNNTSNPQTIYVKIDNPPCYEIYTFDVLVENCPPHIPQGFSPNNDNTNDWFNIQGLYDIFEKHELKIYNRYGTLIFEGNNDNPWYGLINRGLNNHGKIVPVGTYFYTINFNDTNYESQVGWVYVNY
ncbi:gliding motility-associated C-terminal domain-containing protein [Psychroserpens ponticola]|uniref:Gliding motility-associated C-terminal domain-containing protein n=1 Tax=Psychroserpens ponticola TaxID=2932268 RepID=A0ABY7RTB9_9FLAO|nr:gliding motility-associated C-terminal domain-containing protein [Psychroserpens ponticola]WCO00344.1 gliding motility-associated C-terminal domain-containing protein [Psychroserpens ponticola]